MSKRHCRTGDREPRGRWFKPGRRWQFNYPTGTILEEQFRKGRKDRKGTGVVTSTGWAYAILTEDNNGLIKAEIKLRLSSGAGVEIWEFCDRGMRAAKRWCHDTIKKAAKLKLTRIDRRDDKDTSAMVVRHPFRKMNRATRLRLLRRKVENYTKIHEEQIASMRREIAKLEAGRSKKIVPKKVITK